MGPDKPAKRGVREFGNGDFLIGFHRGEHLDHLFFDRETDGTGRLRNLVMIQRSPETLTQNCSAEKIFDDGVHRFRKFLEVADFTQCASSFFREFLAERLA